MKKKSTLLHLVIHNLDKENEEIMNLKQIFSSIEKDYELISNMLDHVGFCPKDSVIESILKKCSIKN